MAVLYIVASAAAGRVWRLPFDDELLAMVPPLPAGFSDSAWDLARFYLNGGNIHPPLTVLYFSILHSFGVSEWVMRLGSLAMMTLALALWQLVALTLIGERGEAPVGATPRLVAVLLFGLSPAAVGLGDAIRWYPQFALLVALFAALYFLSGTRVGRLASAVPLGLAISINLIAPLVILPFAIYRYLLERAWRASFEMAYWAIFALFAAPGLYTAISVLRYKLVAVWASKCARGPLVGIASDVIGVFGGSAIGIGEAWVVIPVIAIAAAAVVTQIDWRAPACRNHLLLLMLGGMVPAAVAGCDESRMFLYMAPILAAVLTLFLARYAVSGATGRMLLLTACTVFPSLVAIGELRAGIHSTERNWTVPTADVIDFIDRNESGDTLVMSTDAVIPWELEKRPEPHRCTSYFLYNQACFADPQHYRSIFIVRAYGDRSQSVRLMQRFVARVAEITRSRDRVAGVRAGHDTDSQLKTKLTGVPHDQFILTVDLYR